MEGIPAVLVTVDPEQSWQARPSRALHPAGFRLGHSLGPPGARDLQKRVALDALDLLVHPIEPGSIARREYPEYAAAIGG
jgi:D-proline reductase (dithiol) PrdB